MGARLGAIALLAAALGAPGPARGQALGAVPGEMPGAVASPGAPAAAVLQGLDKTTARVSTFEAPIGGVARFGTLAIAARACEKKPPTEPPESAAFLEIVDVRPDSPAVKVFEGWMFASSPAVSAMEHPVYDVWVIDCRAAVAPGAAPAAAPSSGDGAETAQ
ncbi:MAG: DUF2155 domain-containing protein [Kiloniellaceae bacterium]